MAHSRLSRFLVALCLAVPAVRTAAAADDKLTVAYTGKLLGYARMPDRQPRVGGPSVCTLPVASTTGLDADIALTLLKQLNAPPGALIVGMGDNFAPELDARRFLEGMLKELYTWDHRDGGGWLKNRPKSLKPLMPDIAAGHGAIPIDNVACFFQLAGYTALVPGKHDFYYGPERLREFARFLATPPEADKTRVVQMLAANLIIDTKDVKAAPRLPASLKPKPKSEQAYQPSAGAMKIDLPAVVLPTMREFTIKNVAYILDTVTGNAAAADAMPKSSITTEREFRYTIPSDAPVLKDHRYQIRPNLVSAWVCPAMYSLYEAEENDPDVFPIPTPKKDNTCLALTELKQAEGVVSLDSVFRLAAGELEGDRNYGLCVALPATATNAAAENYSYYCAPFTVRAPFFGYQHAVDRVQPPARVHAEAQALPAPYALTHVTGSGQDHDVAVFGVVDPDLPEHIGALNYSWVNEEDDRYDTATKTFDPKSALQQQMQHCWMNPTCRAARKVLLAQMPPFKAAQLAGRLRRGWFASGRSTEEQGDDLFDLVIAQADEEMATGEEKRSRSGPINRSGPPADRHDTEAFTKTTEHSRSPFVVVPDRLHSSTGEKECDALASTPSDRCVRVSVQRADVTLSPDKETWSLSHHSDARMFRLKTPVGTGLTLLDAARQTLTALTKAPAAPTAALGAGATLQQLALELMRRDQGNADLAMLQQRDVFDAQWHAAQLVDGATLQSMLDRVFWKGDYTLQIFVTGAAIKEALKKSARFDANDGSSLSVDEETGRGLVTLGVILDPDTKESLIDGHRIDDTRMYGVAVSDYAGMGDTGYPELFAKPPVPPDRLVDIHHFSRLATELCHAISERVTLLHDAACHSREPGRIVDATWQLDGLDQRPPDTTPGLTAPRALQQWLTPSRPRAVPVNAAKPIETVVQDRRIWSVILDSASFGYALNQPSLPAKDASDQFSGVQTARVTAPELRSVAIGYQLRVLREGRLTDRFANSDLSYTRELTQQADNSFLTNQKSNQVNAEGGFYFHVWPAAKQLSGLKALLSGRIESQPASPLTTLAPGLPKVETFRRTLLVAKTGLRLEGDHRWIEGGWEKGALLHSVYEYDFDGTPCTVGVGARSLSNCIKDNAITSNDALAIQQRTRAQQGFFFNARAQMPLPFGNKLTATLENRAELFLETPDDSSIDTRAYENFIASLKVPIVGNLNLAPKFDWYIFRNKADSHTISSTQFSINVDYRFDWHQGLRWGRALRYANPAAGPQ